MNTHTTSDVEEIEAILYAPNLNITQKEYREFIDEVVPKIITTIQQKHAEELEKAVREAINHFDLEVSPLLDTRQYHLLEKAKQRTLQALTLTKTDK